MDALSTGHFCRFPSTASESSRAAPLSVHVPILKTHQALGWAHQVRPSPFLGDTAQQWSSGQGSRGTHCFPPRRAHPAPGPDGRTRTPPPLRSSPPSPRLSAWPRGWRWAGAAAAQGLGSQPGTMRRRRPGLPTSRVRAAEPLSPPRAIAIRYRPCAQRGLSLPRARGPADLETPGGGGTKGGGVGTAKQDDGWGDPGSPAGLGRQESAGAAARTACPPPARIPPGPRRDTRSRRCISTRPVCSFPGREL